MSCQMGIMGCQKIFWCVREYMAELVKLMGKEG